MNEIDLTLDDEDTDPKDCDHKGTGRIQKFDGGRCPLLCARCRLVVGTWRLYADDPWSVHA